MPPFGAEKEKRRGGRSGERRLGAGERILQHALLDRLTLGVEQLQPLGDSARLDVVVRGEQLRAEARSTDASASVDAWAEDEAERIGGRRRIDASDIRERAQAGIIPEPQHLESLGDESAVRLSERDHVAHRGERNEIEQAEQIRLGATAIEFPRASERGWWPPGTGKPPLRPRDALGQTDHHDGSGSRRRARAAEPRRPGDDR